MEYVKFDKEFVERTKWLIENIVSPYEVTLLINCLMGLVSLPTVSTKGDDSDFQATCVCKLKEMCVIRKQTSDEKTFRAVKNAISHMHIEPVNRSAKIDGIILRDKKSELATEFHTELYFSVGQLKEFALFVAELHLKRFAET